MDPYEWFVLGPTLLLGILIPLARSANRRTLGLATIFFGVLLAATTWMPWKGGWRTWSANDADTPSGVKVWRSEHWTETGLSYAWHGALILVLGLAVGAGAWWIGSRPRGHSLVRATGVAAFVVVASSTALGAVALDRYSVPDETDLRQGYDHKPRCGLIVASMASVACMTLSAAMLLKLAKERARRRAGAAVDAATLRQVFR